MPAYNAGVVVMLQSYETKAYLHIGISGFNVQLTKIMRQWNAY